MKQIGSLFEAHRKRLKPPQASVEKLAQEVICEITGLPVRQEHLSYSPGARTLRITAPSVVRTELLKQKPVILKQLQETLGVTNAPKELL